MAAFASWHDRHAQARIALDGGLALIEHCALETYSVLTRLPPPHRAPPNLVRDFLLARFAPPMIRMSPSAQWRFILDLPDRAIAGGASYDALIAATAVANSLTLVSCDRRAAATYERYGVPIELI